MRTTTTWKMDADGFNKLGLTYLNDPAKKNPDRAFACFKKAADMNHSLAQFNLGTCYEDGVGIATDEQKAVQYYQLSADQGNPQAQFKVGYCYQHGVGGEIDENKAFEYYQLSAAQGISEAQRKLGVCYEYGMGVAIDEKKAFEYYQLSANQMNADAQFNVAYCYDDGIGVAKDVKKAIESYQKSANQGNAAAQYNLGVFYQHGTDIEKDEKKAVEYYQLSADQGHEVAQLTLGHCSQNGIGIEKDEKKAVEYYQLSADQGNASAQCRLAKCYEDGVGVVRNLQKAAEYYQKSAEKKNPVALSWVNKEIASSADVIIENIQESTDCYIPNELLKFPVKQIGPYCGSAAFAGGVNYAGHLPYPIYASIHEKKVAGGDIKQTQDVVLTVLENSKVYPTYGPQFDVRSFHEPGTHFNVQDCRSVIMNENCSEKKYTRAILNSFKQGNVLAIAGDSDNLMPVRTQGKNAHWVLGLGYWKGVDNQYYLLVHHHGYYCKWSIHDLYESNKQLPIENPHQKGGDLTKFRFSFFQIPVKKERKITRMIPRSKI